MYRASTRSAFNSAGPRRVFRPTLPNVPAAGEEKAAVLKYRAVLCCDPERRQSAPGTRLGRTKMPPVPAPTPAVSPFRLGVNGNPDCAVTMPEVSHPPSTLDAIP